MKVVINSDYGGFGVSAYALKHLLEIGASCLHEATPKNYYGGESGKTNWQDEWERDRNEYEDIGEGVFADLVSSHNILKGETLYYLSYDVKRTDPDLIATVELLGEKANRFCAKLKVVEIPDDINWEIEERDGMERIREVSRTWQ